MKVLLDPHRLLNFNPFVIYFAPAPTVNDDVKKALRALNKYQGFTRGIFKFKTMEQSASGSDGDAPELTATINRYNMIAKLVDHSSSDYKYAVGKVNFNLGHDEIETAIQSFVVEVCKLNAKYLETYLRGQSTYQEIAPEQRVNLMQMRQIFLNAISMRGYRQGIWARLMGDKTIEIFGPVPHNRGDNSHRRISPEIKEKLREMGKKGDIEYVLSWCEEFFGTPDKKTSDRIAKEYYKRNYTYVKRGNRVETKPDSVPEVTIEIRKMVKRKFHETERKEYGIIISAYGKNYVIFFGSKYETMLYICILLRKKLGEHLYRYEFYDNNQGKSENAKFKRENSHIWFKKVFDILYPLRGEDFKYMFDKIARDAGRPLSQAKSQIVKTISDHLEGDNSILYYCNLSIVSKDEIGDSFYHIRIEPENIIIPKELQPLLDDFYDIMQVDKPE